MSDVDIVCFLLTKSFTTLSDSHQKTILTNKTPQPLLNYSKISGVTTGNLRTRNFQLSWYSTYKWLCGSVSLEKLFCWPCLLMGNKKHNWNETGFRNMANATRSFVKHEASFEHIKNAIRLNDLKHSLDIVYTGRNIRKDVSNFKRHVQLNRVLMSLPIKAIIFLNNQNFALSFCDEKNVENNEKFLQLLQLLIDSSQLEIRQHFETIKPIFMHELSKIKKNIIHCFYRIIFEYITNEIQKDARFFSIIVDELIEERGTVQWSVIVRYVDKNGLLVERFIGFIDPSDRTPRAIESFIFDEMCKLDASRKLVAQTYDASCLTLAQIHDLQTNVKMLSPQANFVYSLGHRLQLTIKQCTNSFFYSRIFFTTLAGFPSIFHMASHVPYIAQSVIFKQLPRDVNRSWSCLKEILQIIIREWKLIKEVLKQLVKDPLVDGETIRQADHFLNKMNSFQFSFLVCVFTDIFDIFGIMLSTINNKTLDITMCLKAVEVTKQRLVLKKNHVEFSMYVDKAKTFTSLEVKSNQVMDQMLYNYKGMYFQLLERIGSELNTRFHDIAQLQFVALGDSNKFLMFQEKFPTALLNNLLIYYGAHFDSVRLRNELVCLYSDTRFHNLSLSAIVQMLNRNEMRDVLKEAYKVFCLILSIPCTSLAHEPVSTLERIKCFLKNSRNNNQLQETATMSIEKSLLENLIENTEFHEDVLTRLSATSSNLLISEKSLLENLNKNTEFHEDVLTRLSATSSNLPISVNKNIERKASD